ncbi:MAG TPA: hypothetical protein PKK66_05130 [Bacteroidales bacterium]|nr:hypothetical protein [Bacteroidales bacterium]
MKILIDSGATKSDCILLTDNKKYIHHFTCRGINANYCDDNYIFDVLDYFQKEIRSKTAEIISDIAYYGAGCGNAENAQRIATLLSKVFPNIYTKVGSDLLGMCRLLSPGKAGMIAILGTGASACLFNGEEIVRQAPSLGYLLGDEGSGTYIGKLFIISYFRKELPNEIFADFEQEFQLTATQILHKIYQEKSPNLFFASLSPFIAAHQKNIFIQDLLDRAFNDFFEKQILFFDDYRDYSLSIAGSVAFHFAESIKKNAHRYGVTMGNLTASPLIYYQQSS